MTVYSDPRHRAEVERIRAQMSAAEVPGFDARTTIDDAIRKLYAIRCQIRTPVPPELPALLDDIDELVERAVDLAFDPDAPEVEDASGVGFSVDGQTYEFATSGAGCINHCSCGGVIIPPPAAAA